jgi:Ca2+-transporting ATPase
MNQNDDAGLSAPEAAQRLRQDGPNALPSAQRRKWRHIARETLQEPMFMLLLAAGTLYLLLGDFHEGLVLFGLVLVVLAMAL